MGKRKVRKRIKNDDAEFYNYVMGKLYKIGDMFGIKDSENTELIRKRKIKK